MIPFLPEKIEVPRTADSEETESWYLTRVNPFMRVLRYEQGERFLPHFDSYSVLQDQIVTAEEIRDVSPAEVEGKKEVEVVEHDPSQPVVEKTFITMQLYLNKINSSANPYTGSTLFVNKGANMDAITRAQAVAGSTFYRCVPESGRALLFEHYLLHAGEEVEGLDAVKYTIRSDIFYCRGNPRVAAALRQRWSSSPTNNQSDALIRHQLYNSMDVPDPAQREIMGYTVKSQLAEGHV